jgi:hypothetical protein
MADESIFAKPLPVYWTMANKQSIKVDDMGNGHVRNAFKVLIVQHNKLKREYNTLVDMYDDLMKQSGTVVKSYKEVTLNGDMAQEFNDKQEEQANDPEGDGCPF